MIKTEFYGEAHEMREQVVIMKQFRQDNKSSDSYDKQSKAWDDSIKQIVNEEFPNSTLGVLFDKKFRVYYALCFEEKEDMLAFLLKYGEKYADRVSA